MGYSNYYGSGHQDDSPTEDALTRRARRRKEWEDGAEARNRAFLQQRLQNLCVCRHDRREHEDGQGRCSGWLPHAAAVKRTPCICTGFVSGQPDVPPEWRLTS
jgi:hypothetical protein